MAITALQNLLYDFAEKHVDEILSAVETDDNLGLCIGCGEESYGVEPDARNYVCESCGQPYVYGAEELLLYVV